MKKKIITQEILKIVACVTMLIDHLGAVFFPGYWLRIVGRMAFPLYCFLLTEGVTYSRDHRHYSLRLMMGALLAELPYDLLFYGRFTWEHQSVMITLLLGLGMVLWGRKKGNMFLSFAVCFFIAEFLNTDYGGWGIALIGLFAVTTNLAGAWLYQLAGMTVIFYAMGSFPVALGTWMVPIQMFGLLALIPIRMYSGRKLTRSKVLQNTFYLFYPAHLTVLLLLKTFF